MNGHDVLRTREEIRPRIEPFLDPDEQLDVVVPASSRPAKAVKVVAAGVWPFFREADRFLLVATDRRWLVLESAQEKHAGALQVRATVDRSLRLQTSWLTRFEGFDRPYAVDPVYELWAVAANRAADAREAGGTWDLEADAPHLTEADDDPVTEALGAVVTRAGRLVPRRRSR